MLRLTQFRAFFGVAHSREVGDDVVTAPGWPAPEDPDSEEDAELGGRDSIADRLCDEVSWLRQCAD